MKQSMSMNQYLYGNEVGTELDAEYAAGKAAGLGKTEPESDDMMHLPKDLQECVMVLHHSTCLWIGGNIDRKSENWLSGYAESIQAQREEDADAESNWFLNNPSA